MLDGRRELGLVITHVRGQAGQHVHNPAQDCYGQGGVNQEGKNDERHGGRGGRGTGGGAEPAEGDDEGEEGLEIAGRGQMKLRR